MRLLIQRNQSEVLGKRGRSEGFEFTLNCQLQLTHEELGIVDRYRLRGYPVTYRTYQGVQIPSATIGDLMAGTSQTLNDVEILIKNEEVICDKLPTLFEVIRTFGGTLVVDYPRNPDSR